MNGSRILVILALVAFFTPALAADSHLSVTALVYDYVNLPEPKRKGAEAVASRIMRQAGVEIEWLECTPDNCRSQTGAYLALRLVPERMMASWKLDSSHMAFSLVTRNSKFSHIAGILTDRVERCAERLGYPLELVLGHVMAHEFGHLLLRDKRHSVAGVMSFPINRDYLVRASKGMQKFRPGQARRLRHEVARRTRLTANGGLTHPTSRLRTRKPDLPNLGITVFVYNYARVEDGSLERAERIAGQTFRHAGIDIVWTGCPTTEKERTKYTACRTKDGPRPLVLRIMPKAPERFSGQKHVFGAAYLGDGSKRAILADIFVDRVENATMEKLYSGIDRVMASPLPASFRPGVTLGVVLTRELGHLLLGSNSHTRHGIMRGSWDRQDLENAYLGKQLFTVRQVKRLQANISARTRSDLARSPNVAVEPELEVQLHVYNYARIPDQLLKRAQQEVSHILGETGLEIHWVPCALTPEELDNFHQCNGRRRRTDLVIAILPRDMAKKMIGAHDVFGVAASSRNGFAYRADIFYHCVEEYAGKWQASPSLLLGHFIAHEIGHLLLGANSHSRSGIMHVPWTKVERQRIHQAGLLFTRVEAKRIREDVRSRGDADQ